MFDSNSIELKKRMLDDPLVNNLYSHDNCKVFYEHSVMLSAIFASKAHLNLEMFFELSKEDFMGILIDSGILVEKGDDNQAEMKRKFNAENILATTASVSTFDPNYLTYIDFIDCLVRVAYLYNFPEQDKANYVTMD